MKKFKLITLTLLIASSGYSQMIAFTQDGRRVILNEDGTWKFAPEETVTVPEQTPIPARRKFLHPEFSRDVNADYYYQQEYDEFDDQTRTAVGVKMRDGLYLRFYYYSPGLLMKTVPDTVVMMFVSVSSSKRFQTVTDLKLSLDGEQLAMNKFRRLARITPVGFREFAYRGIPIRTFLRILSADYVSGKIHNTEFVLTQAHREAFRDFASRMK